MAGISDKKHEAMAVVVRQAVAEAFVQIVNEEGFGAVTMQLIANKAGMSTGSLYNYFSNKEDIVKFVLQKLIDDLCEYAAEPIETEDPVEKLRVLVERFCVFGVKYSAVFEIKKQFPCEDIEHAKENQARLTGAFQKLIAEGIEKGVFAPVDSDIASKFILSLFIGSKHLLDSWFTEDLSADTSLIMSFVLPYLKNGI